MNATYWLLGAAVLWLLAYLRAPLIVSTVGVAAALWFYVHLVQPAVVVTVSLWILFGVVALLLNWLPLRRRVFSRPALAAFRRMLPTMSATEREALAAGTVWWDAELFSGRPRWKRLLTLPAPELSPEERAFLAGPVDELCRLLDDWHITHEREDLPPEVWKFLKEQRFFGMIIPKRYGGLEFSALAHSTVVMKVASRSVTAAVTVMVPNSLGPAELLLHYGTDEQKDYYLPRLARGAEMPCFALTGPEAGSDAAAMPDTGIVCRAEFGGEKNVLGIRLNWDKRYITLGPVATVLGLAFKLFDPERLLGGEVERGITVALIPTDTPGIEIGRRHNPLNVPFQNGPNRGRDVFIPVGWVIGGVERVGQGWRMLMESLAAGRSISLPALSTGSGKLASRATGAYARIRRQFNTPIGRFEGIEEALARIGGYAYMMDAARRLTCQAVDLGEKPSVISAIVKYQLTEHMRRVVNDAMDIQGGSGICLGPRNYIGCTYQALPISITVEGANILTRSLIIYGQGAIRCHPYVYREVEAVAEPDENKAVRDFDRALFGHVGFVLSNVARSLFLGLGGARLVPVPIAGAARRYAQQVTRYSAAFAFASDVAMLALGGSLKRREKLSGRLADALSFLYLASATVRHFQSQGCPSADRPLLDWACHYCLMRVEQALTGLIRNFPGRPLRILLRLVMFPLGRRTIPPSDALGQRVAALLLEPSEARDRLTDGVYVAHDVEDRMGQLEDALNKVIAAEPIESRLRAFARERGLVTDDLDVLLPAGIGAGVLTETDADRVRVASAARRVVIAVDDFPAGPLHQAAMTPSARIFSGASN